MTDDELTEASPCKLRNGDWGCKTQTPVQAGDTVRIVTRANKQWRAQITQIVWTDNQVCICATESEKSADQSGGNTQPAARTKARQSDRFAAAASKRPSTDPTDRPPAPPRTDVPPTDELDAMADSAADDSDDFDDVMSALDEIERDPR